VNFRIFDETNDLIAAAAETLLRLIGPLSRAVIGLSGGSSPEPLFRLLATPHYRAILDAKSIVWALVDERYVPRDHPQSNAGAIERTLFAGGMAPAHRFLTFDTTMERPADSAARFEAEWRDLSIERLDVVFLGLGTDDGHTASLFPETTALEAEGIATSVFVPKLDQWRVTLTKPVLRDATTRLVLASGAAKGPMLERVRAGERLPIVEVTEGLDSWFFCER
jgi:6-phosphogluconolactonase